MTAAPTDITASADAPADLAPHRLRVLGALLARDFHVLASEPGRFLLRTVSQPLMLVFVFTYVFPTIGQGIRGGDGDVSFTTILVPGVIAISVLIKGIQTVALPLVQEFGYTREIEDRVMAPIGVSGVAVAKILSGAIQGLMGAVIVMPIALLLPAEPVDLQVAPVHLVAVLLLSALAASTLGLALGTSVSPNQVPLMFSIVILPITFLGATYYPWASLSAIPWLQWVSLVNPLVYIAEGMRMGLTSHLDHMAPWGIYLGLIGFIVVVGALALRNFRGRVVG